MKRRKNTSDSANIVSPMIFSVKNVAGTNPSNVIRVVMHPNAMALSLSSTALQYYNLISTTGKLPPSTKGKYY